LENRESNVSGRRVVNDLVSLRRAVLSDNLDNFQRTAAANRLPNMKPKRAAAMPNDQELSHRRLATSERRKSEANN
jgi:hypothetical protein